MITSGLVITERDLPVFQKIVEQGMKEVEFLSNYYNPEYGEDIKKLYIILKKFNEVNNDPKINQVSIEFSLRSIKIFKTLIYRYLKHNAEQVDKKDIDSITSMLERLDWWIEEYLNIEEVYLKEHIIFRD